MYDDLLEILKKKKQKKDKIKIFSYINNTIFEIYKNFDIDIIRIDIEELANLFGYKDQDRIFSFDLIPIMKNIIKKNNSDKFKHLIAYDISVLDLFENDDFSLKKILELYRKSNSDILSFNINHNVINLIEKLSKIKIPTMVYAKNNSINEKNKRYFEQISNRLIEAESKGAVIISVEKFSPTFVLNLKESVSIPVVSDEKNIKNDGYYAKFTTNFGLLSDIKGKYLNLYELIKDGINDCILDNKIK